MLAEFCITQLSVLAEFCVTQLSMLAEFSVTRLSMLAEFSITQLSVLATRLEPPVFCPVLPTRLTQLTWLTQYACRSVLLFYLTQLTRSACRSVLLSWLTRLGLTKFSPLSVTFAAAPVNLE
jgi:hypothetical protein